MTNFDAYPIMPQTTMDGFVYGAITPLTPGRQTGAGFLQGPDGSRAGLQWELSDSAFIMRVEAPSGNGWGVYRVGFILPVNDEADLVENLQQVLPRLKILHSRIRGTVH